MAQTTSRKSGPLVLVGRETGVTVVPSPTPLTRLNYFDGKFLRAQDLEAEQRYLRQLVHSSNQAGGFGVAHGFDVSLGSGDSLALGAGLAIDPQGRVLLLPQETSVEIERLIEQSRSLRGVQRRAIVRAGGFEICEVTDETPPGAIVPSADLYLLTLSHAEALCGEEDVFGKLCEDACITGTDRPYRVEGVVIRAVPLLLQTLLETTAAIALDRRHLRSRVASAYYADERARIGHLISGDGLRSDVWCFGAQPERGFSVPIGVLARSGSSTTFLDAWIARREHIDSPAKRYWQWRMRMRPWDVYLAQILQFQCQLHDVFRDGADPGSDDDPCNEARRLVGQAAGAVAALTTFYRDVSDRLRNVAPGDNQANDLLRAVDITSVGELNQQLAQFTGNLVLGPTNRILPRRGIIGLPPAGYLPVAPTSVISVNQQVRALLGEGVDLRFCIVRPDFVAHALEEAQHMERISLVQGLDNPENRPGVDILVPNGEIIASESPTAGQGFDGAFSIRPQPQDPPMLEIRGAGRAERLETGGGAFHFAGSAEAPSTLDLLQIVRSFTGSGDNNGNNGPVSTPPLPETPITSFTLANVSFGPVSFISRLGTIAFEARRFLFAARPSVGRSPGDSFAVALPSGAQMVNLWMTMDTDRDPFQLDAGSTTRVGARFAAALATTSSVYADLQLRGDFRVVQPAETRSTGTGTTTTVRGTIDAFLSARTHAGDSSETPEADTNLQTLDAVVERIERDGQPPVVQLTLGRFDRGFTLGGLSSPRLGNGFIFTTQLSGTPLEATTRVVFQRPNATLGVGDFGLVSNPAVLSPGSQSHTLATHTLDVIGAVLAALDPNFAETASRLLFPPSAPDSGGLTVRAIEDWVLFHRRRDKQCAAEAPEPASPRRYAVYHLRVESASQAVANAEILRGDDDQAISALDLEFVNQVEFAGGLASLSTAQSDILAAWGAVDQGNRIGYSALASLGSAAADGVALATTRLGQLRVALSPITQPAEDAASDVLPAVPAPLVVPGTDGSIVLITLQVERQTTCHLVLRALDPVSRVVEIIQDEGVSGALERGIASVLGEAEFQEGIPQVVAGLDDIVAAWSGQGGGTIRESMVLWREGDESISTELRVSQAQEIQDALGGGPTPVPNERANDLGPECSTVTIFQAEVQEPVNLTFIASAQEPIPRIRVEGVSELVADYLLEGAGGTAGQVVIANLQLTLDAPISNSFSDDPPVLLIDDPNAEVPGTLSGPQGNMVQFEGVSITMPGAGATRRLRIRNLRVNATASGAGGADQVRGSISIVAFASISVQNIDQVLANIGG